MKLLDIANIKKFFGVGVSASEEKPYPLPLVAGHHYLNTLVRKQEDSTFQMSSLFLLGVPQMPVQPLIDGIKDALPKNGSFLVFAGTEADKSFDYTSITVSSLDLLTKQQAEDVASAIDAKLRTMVEAKPTPSQDSKVKLQPA